MKETTITLRKTSLSLIAFLMVLFTVWSASAFYDNAENGLPTSRWELVNGLGDISYSADFAYGGSYSLKVNDSDASVPTYSVNYSGDFVVVDFWFYDDVISQIEFGVNTRNGAVLEWDNYLYVAGNVGVNYSIVSGTNYSDELIVDSAIVRSANWHHVVMNLNYSSDLRVAYIDDVLVLSETRSLSSPYTGAFYVAAYGGVSYADNIWINSIPPQATCSVCNETCSPCGGGCTATTLSSMFSGVTSFDSVVGDITGWNTSCITAMDSTFFGSDFNQNISSWDTGVVTTMNGMFYGDGVFNQPIGAWNTSQVSNMGGMLGGATAFDQDLSGWDVTALTAAPSFAGGSGLSTANYDLLLVSWGSQAVQTGVWIEFAPTQYSVAGKAGRDVLINNYSWNLNDGGMFGCDPFTNLTCGLINYYKLDGNANDVFGFINGTESGFVYDTTGIINLSRRYEYEGLTDIDVTRTSSSSVAGWFKIKADASPTTIMSWGYSQGGCGGGGTDLVQYNHNGSHMLVNIDCGSYVMTSTNPVSQGVWHHFVHNYDAGVNTWFIDGVEQIGLTIGQPMSPHFQLGGYYYWGGNVYEGNVSFDELAFFNNTQTQSRVDALYNNGYGVTFDGSNFVNGTPAHIGEMPTYSKFDGNTTDFNAVYDLTSVAGVILENSTAAKISFNVPINVSGADLDSYVHVSYNLVGVDSVALPNLNVSANLSLQIPGFKFISILKDGVLCTDCSNVKYDGSLLTFTVSGFSNYSALNGTSVLYDDFETGSLNLTKWAQTSGTPSVSSNRAYNGTYSVLVDGILLHRLTTLLMNDIIGSSGKVVLQFFVNLNSSDSYDNFQFSLLNSAGADLLQFQAGYPISGYWGLYTGSWTDSGISSTSGAGNLHNKWVRMRVLIDNDNNQTSWRIGDSNVSAFTGVSAGEIASQLKFYGISGNLFYVDDVSFWDYDTFGWGNVTPYTGCMPDGVAENNEHYNLTQDCTLNEFTVGNDVVVDCNGYSLIMSGTSNAAGTFVNMYGSNGVVLNNCVIVANITGASFPSWLSVRGGGDNIVINNLTVRNSVSTFRGIWIGQETEAYTNNVTINGLYFDNVTTGSTGDSVVSFAKGDFLLKDSVWENMYVMGYLIHLYPLANVEVNNVTFRNISGRNDQNHHLITGGAGGNLSLLPYLGVFNSVFDNVKAGAGATQIGSVFALGDGTYFDFIGNEVKNTNYQSGDAWTKQGNAWIHPSSYAGANMTHIVITGNNFHDMLMYNTTSAFGSTSLIAIISVPGQYWTYGVNISGNNFTNIDGLVFTSPSNQTIGVVVNNNRFQNVTCQRSICQVITSSSPNLEFSGNWMNESSEVSYSPGSTIRNIASSLFRDNVVINPRVSRVGSSSYGGFAIHGPNSTVVNNTFYYDRQWYDDAYGNYPSCNSGNVTQYRLEVGLGCFASDNRIIVDPAVLTLTNPRCSTPITTVQVLACNDILYENNNISVRLSLGGSGSVRLNGTVRNNVLNGIQIGNLNGSTVEIYNNSFVAETQCGPDCHSMSATFSSATNDVLGSTVLFHDNYIENPIVIFSINKGGTVALPASSRNMNVNVYNNNFANYTKTYLDQYNASVNGNIQYGLAIDVASANVNFTNNTVVKHLVQFGTTQISNNSVGGLITFADNGVVADLAIITITQSVQTNGSNPNIVFDGNTWDVPKYYLRPINSVNGVVLDVLGRYPDLNSSELWNATNYRLIGCDYFNTDYSYGSLTYADAINCFAGATLDLFDGGGLTLDEIRLTSGNGTTGASVRLAVFTGWNLKNPIYAGFSYDYAVWQNVSFAGSALTYWSSPVQMYDYGPILFTNVTNASLSGAVFYNSNGMINYTGSIDLTGIDNSTIDDAMYINNENIGVTSQTYPGLNVSAKLSYFSTGVTNISDVEVLRNGNTCIAPQCDNFALVNDTVSFDILGFTNYVLLIGCIPNGQITGSRVLTADCTNRHWSLMGGSSLDCDSHVISESDILINGTVNLKNCVMTNTANECVNVVFGNGSLITGNDFSGCSRGAIWVNQ